MTKEARHPLHPGELVAVYETDGFTHPDLVDEMVRDALRLAAAHQIASGTLDDGMQFQFGWSLLTLRACAEGLFLCEPDFSLAEPHLGLVESLTLTAQVAALQAWANTLADLPATACFFLETIGMLPGAFEASEVWAIHGPRLSPTHSGWVFAPRESDLQDAEAQGLFDEVAVLALLDTRPGLLKALALPPGVRVAFCDENLLRITDADGGLRWQWDEREPQPGWESAAGI